MNEEINMWRKYFLEEIFKNDFKDVSEVTKKRISNYFLAIPSVTFTSPLKEFHECIAAIIQRLEEKK